MSLKQLSRILLHMIGPLILNRVPLSRTHQKFVIANAAKHSTIYLPIFCVINICENLKHLHDAYVQKKGLCKHKHQEGENFYKEKGIRTFRLSQGRSEKHGFIILQKIKAVPQNQGYLIFVFSVTNGVDLNKLVF